jgi:uncharacterized spore protein YtfJ
VSIEQFAQTLLEQLKSLAQTETVIGKPIETPFATVIPVSKVSMGFGLGNSKNKIDVTGSGGGASIEPLGFLVITPDGDVKLMQLATKDSSMGQKLAEIVPELWSHFKGKKEKSCEKADHQE